MQTIPVFTAEFSVKLEIQVRQHSFDLLMSITANGRHKVTVCFSQSLTLELCNSLSKHL